MTTAAPKGKTTDKADDVTEGNVSEDKPRNKEWVTTAPDGSRVATKPDGNPYDVKPCMLFSATDPVTAEVN